MKKLILALLLCPGLLFAGDFDTTFEITGGTPAFLGSMVELRLDIDDGRYLPVNGVIENDENRLIPVAGTCYLTIEDGIYCLMNGGPFAFKLDLNSNDGISGTITIMGPDGINLDSAEIVLTGVDY